MTSPGHDPSEKSAFTVTVLAVGAHPLDVFFLCGGTLARYARGGHDIHIAVMSEPTSESDSVRIDDVTAIREAETERAASLIGAMIHYLRIPGFSVRDDSETRLRVAELIRKAVPHVVVTHDPGDYHTDHQQTSAVVMTAAMMARQVTVVTESPPFPLPVGPEVVFMDTIAGLGFEPEEFVDITSVYDTKRRMIECYETEVAEWQDHPVLSWLEWMEVNSRYRGIQVGARYAEAFRRAQKWVYRTTERLLP
jgi:LmbE family N-acetylglucosaminyl deacetylase